jgi:prolyl oligopeptidase
MKHKFFQAVSLLAILSLQPIFITSAQEHPAYPKTRMDNVTETLHGVTVNDPYRWLENQTSPETRAWIESQIKYTQSALGALEGRDRIKQRLTRLMKVDTIGAPIVRGNRYFLVKRRADQNQSVIYVREGLSGKDVVLIDPNTMSEDHTTSAQMIAVSRDGKLMAYGIREGGEDEMVVRLLNVDTRKDLPDTLPKARYFGVSIKPDRSGFYYTKFSLASGSRVHYHRMGADTSGDEEIFGKGYGPTQIISAALSEDGKHLMLYVSHGASGDHVEVYYKNVESNGPITAIVNDVRAAFNGAVRDGILYLHTNWKAPNWRVLAVDLKTPSRDNWREVVKESGAVLEDLSLVGGRMLVSYLENVSSRVKVFDLKGGLLRSIDFPVIGTVNAITGQWDKDEAFLVFSSFAHPTTIYRYEVSTGKQAVWNRINIPVDSKSIEVKQVWYESKDKTRVPMFIVHRKGLALDSNRPTLLTGYGGFNVSLSPNFSAQAAFWAEHGGVYAIPNLRGGSEFGEKWHEAGMLDKKQNVFDDFIAASEWLIANKYTNPSKLAISGGSNGGLLVGAAMTQRPELYRAVICAVPLLDMIRYHKFLVARFWIPEYGSSENPEQFKYIHAYSPYHRVKKGTKYPAVMFVTGDADTRVDPLHARKMTALMQAATGSDYPVLLHYDTKAGHSGGLPVTKQIEDVTDQMSFLFWQLGVK